ncbi:MAG: kinase [Planctomycetes bacterium]|nr:kinase [Planctomycetota bacterium]
MILSRTPFRISFFGGGTDYPGWYRQHGGAVLSTTIDKYCYLSVRYLPPFFDYRYRVVWSKVENRRRLEDIEHPVVRCLIGHLGIDRGVEVHHVGDLPARSGMGSSSAFTVGLLHALHALEGRMVGKQELLHQALFVEQELLRETVGSQDQAAAAHGGFNRITFAPTGEIAVTPVLLRPGRAAELDDHLMLFYTGIARTAATVAQSYVADLPQKRRHLRILRDLVDESIELLASERSIAEFGLLLDEAWHSKKSLGAGISNDAVDTLYARAKAAGALGGKLTGAGGGGFLLLFVPPAQQAAVREALPELVHVPFRFENSGSQIIFYDREQDFAPAEAERRGRAIAAFRELGEPLADDEPPAEPVDFTIPYPEPVGAGAAPKSS